MTFACNVLRETSLVIRQTHSNFAEQFRFGVLSIFLLSGCSTLSSPQPIPVITQSQDDSSQPLVLRVTEEINDGKRLHIGGQVMSKIWWESSTSFIHLKVLKDGVVTGESLLPIASLIDPDIAREYSGPFLRPKEVKPFRLSADAAQITDYQIELVWGDDSKSLQALLDPKPIISITDVSLLQKSGKNSVIVGNILNGTPKRLTGLTLGISFHWVQKGASLDLSAAIPENEQNITVGKLSIGPGEIKPLKIELESELPMSPDGSWQPIVRVIENAAQRTTSS